MIAKIISEAARALAAKRKTFAGGAPTVLRPCPYCTQLLGARGLRIHKPNCDKNPRHIS